MQPVEVRFRRDLRGRLIPEQFCWGDQSIQVDATGRRWRQGDEEHILCLTPGGDMYELVYRRSDEVWYLAPAHRHAVA